MSNYLDCFLLFLSGKNKMAKFLRGTLWVTVVHHCHRMKAHEKKMSRKCFRLYHTSKNWNISPFIVTMFNWTCLFHFTGEFCTILCSSYTLIAFPSFTHIRKNSWLLKHAFHQLYINCPIYSRLEKTECVDTRVKSETRPVIKQGYQSSYELLPGRNFFKRKLTESCKNDLYIYPCNQETNTIFLICSMLILDDLST